MVVYIVDTGDRGDGLTSPDDHAHTAIMTTTHNITDTAVGINTAIQGAVIHGARQVR